MVTDDALRIYAIGVDTLRSRDVLALVPTWSELTTVFPSLDSKTHTLYFQPLAGLDLKNAVVEATRLRTLVEFRGDEANPAKWITLRGLTFRHAERTVMDNREPLMRSDWTIYRGSAVFFNGAEDCALTDSFIDQVGGNAVFVNNYNRRIAIRGTQIAKARANGICFIGDPQAARSALFNYYHTQDLEKIDRTPGPKGNNFPAIASWTIA